MVKLGKGEKIWTRVGIDDTHLKEIFESSPDESIKNLADKVKENDFELFLKGLTVTKSLTTEATLLELYSNYPHKILDLFYMNEFMKGKGRAIRVVAKSSFKSRKSFEVSDYSDLALLYELYKCTPVMMLEVYIRDQVMNRGFDSYSLKSKKVSRPKFDLQTLDEDKMIEVLKEVDKKIKDKKHSHCWHVSRQDEFTELYIRREDEPILVSKLRNNIRDVLAKSTIIRFDKYGRKVDLWSEKDAVAVQMLGYLARRFFAADAQYQPEVYRNDMDKVETLLKALITGSDKEIQLLKFQRINAPIENSPRIVIESGESIVPSLRALEQAGFDMTLDCVKNTEEIKIEYKKRNYYISFKVDESHIILIPKRQRGTRASMEAINSHMKSIYDLRISLGG